MSAESIVTGVSDFLTALMLLSDTERVENDAERVGNILWCGWRFSVSVVELVSTIVWKLVLEYIA